MGQILLVTGGSRSGKSAYAQKAAEALPAPRAFIATCPSIDEEMQERIRKHQAARSQKGWQTIEETLDIAGAIHSAANCSVVLVDCLTLWINNILYVSENNNKKVSESDIAAECAALIAACRRHAGTVILVTNEIGMGIIPENALARLYRDLVGRCNQVMAEASDRVVLLVSGQPMEIKPSHLS